jgi:hypothetical protein
LLSLPKTRKFLPGYFALGHNFCHAFMDGFLPPVDVTVKTGISGFM